MRFKYNMNQKVRTIKNNFLGRILHKYKSVTFYDDEEFKNHFTKEELNGHWYLIRIIYNVGDRRKYNGKVAVPESDIILLPCDYKMF